MTDSPAAPPQVLRTSVPARSPMLAHELPETGETVICDDQQHQLVVLNPTGAAVWYLTDGARSVAEIADLIAAETTGDAAAVLEDVVTFITSLAARGAVTVR